MWNAIYHISELTTMKVLIIRSICGRSFAPNRREICESASKDFTARMRWKSVFELVVKYANGCQLPTLVVSGSADP